MNASKKLAPLNIRCNRIKNNASTQIYILDSLQKLTCSESKNIKNYSVSFINYNNPSNIQWFVTEILKRCNNQNVLIYSTWSSADFMNNVVSSLPSQYEYKHLTIINFSCVFDSIVYIPKNLKIRKITNVFKFVRSFMPTPVHYNRTYIGVINNNYFHYRLIQDDTKDASQSCTKRVCIEDSWWFKWYFSVPLCASGRLQQVTGTCWFNATLNSLLLTPFIAELLKERFYGLNDEEKNLITNLSFETCIDQGKNLRLYLFTIVYLILIKEERAIYSNGDIVKQAAITLKQKGNENGYHPDLAMNAMLKILFDQNKYISLYYYNNFSSKLNTNVDFIILLNCPQNKSGSCIFVNDTVYVLESGIIGMHDLFKLNGHSVTGLKCDDIWYIYDSNNKIFECKWFLGNCDTVLKEQYSQLQHTFPYFPALTYTRDTLTKTEYEQVLQIELKIILSFRNPSNTKIQYLKELQHKLGFYTDHFLYKEIENKIKAIRNVKELLNLRKQQSLDNVIRDLKTLNISLNDKSTFTDDDVNLINTLRILDLYFKEFENEERINNIKSYLTEYTKLKEQLELIKFTNAIEYEVIKSRIVSLENLLNKYMYFIIRNSTVLPIGSDTMIQGGSQYIRTNEKIDLGKNVVRNIYVLNNNKRKKYVKYKGSFLTISQAKYKTKNKKKEQRD